MILKNTSLTSTALLSLILIVFSSPAFAGIVRLPQTGQVAPYYTGDDGDIPSGVPWPNPRFSSGGTGCRADNLTGLTWAENGNLPSGQLTWEQALAAIATLNGGGGICGHTDWRLPNVNELATLLNANEANSATWLNATGQGFNNVQANIYWTSTTYADTISNAWTIDMGEGIISESNKASIFYVLPVRGTTAGPALVPATGQTFSYSATGGEDGDLLMGVPLPTTRFQDNGDGTATDALTGLVWLQDANCIQTNYPTFDAGGSYGPATLGRVIWERALDFIDGMNAGSYPLCDGGHHDWRLPNRNELRSFMDYGPDSSFYYGSLMPTYGFSNIQENDYWSSTTRANDTSDAWILNTWYNTIGTAGKTVFRYVWPVRSAPAIQVTPSPSYAFGDVYIDDTKIQTFTVSNSGTADLVIGPLSLTGIKAYFQIVNDRCSYAVIEPGGNCTVDVQYLPGSLLSMDANLGIPWNDLNTVNVNLTGTGKTCSYSSVITFTPSYELAGEFNDIQTAYDDVSTVDTMIIGVRMIEFPGVNFNLGKTIALEGGYDCSFAANTYYSTIGPLTITTGEVTISNIVIR